jgi:hypothetical protein
MIIKHQANQENPRWLVLNELSQHRFFTTHMSFDIYALTADEAAPYVDGNKSKTHNFLNALYNKRFFQLLSN